MNETFSCSQIVNMIEIPCVAVLPDTSGFIIFDTNQQFLHLVQKQRSEVIDKTYFSIFKNNPFVCWPDWKDSFGYSMALNKTTNLGVHKWLYPFTDETTHLDIRYFNIMHYPIKNKKGEILVILKTFREVTAETINKELYLKAQKTEFFGNWWINVKNRTMMWSEGTKKILEVPADFIPDFDNSKLFYPSVKAEQEFLSAALNAMENRTNLHTVVPIISAKGNLKTLLVDGSPDIVDNICIGIHGIVTDITQKLEFERKIEIQEYNLNEISYTQNHLIRAPLARILAILDFIQTDCKVKDPSLRDYLTLLADSAHELDNIINKIVQNSESDI